MSDHNLNDVMQSLFKGMDTVLSTKTVVGEPTQIGDKIPITAHRYPVCSGSLRPTTLFILTRLGLIILNKRTNESLHNS